MPRMKRKVVQVGPSTLMVSLPTKWAQENNVQKGAELEVTLYPKEIIYSLEKRKPKEEEISIDITLYSKHMLSRLLEILYVTSYGKIILSYSKQEIYADKEDQHINLRALIKNLSHRFIGMEIVSQTECITELRCFTIPEEQDLVKIEKRIFYLFKEITQEFLHGLDKHHEFHAQHYAHHDNVVKFIFYYLRVLDQSNKSEEEKKQLYSLYMIIDKMMDKFRHLSERVAKYGTTPRIKKHLLEIMELMYEQFEALHKSKISAEIVSKRYALVKKIESADYAIKELLVVSEIRIFLDTINDFSRVVMVENLEKIIQK